MGFSKDPYESFKNFPRQNLRGIAGWIFKEFPAERVNATEPSEVQQAKMRDIVKKRLDLKSFKLKTQGVSL